MPEPITDRDDPSDTELADLFAHWHQHLNHYGDVAYGAALTKDSGEWKNITTFLVPERRNAAKEAPIRADYGDVLIIRDSLAFVESKTVLQQVVREGVLRLPDAPA